MIATVALTVVTTIAAAAAPPPVRPGTIQADPAKLAVTTFFNGAELRITGTGPASMQLAVLLTGPAGTVELKKKGKVWGLLWMNVGEISFEDVPSTYLLATAGEVCELAPFEVRQRNRIGLDVLGGRSGANADDEAPRLFGELVKLKQHERLFGSFENALETRPEGDGEVVFSTVLAVPACVPEGSYRLALWGFRDAHGEVLAATEVTVEEVGITHDIAALARDHGTLYGILALLLALVVGIVTGLVFGLAGKGGH